MVVVWGMKGCGGEKGGIGGKEMIMCVKGEWVQGLEVKKGVKKMRGGKGSEGKVEVKGGGC